MPKKLRLVLKIVGWLFAVILGVFIVFFYRFSSPKSDAEIQKEFAKNNVAVFIKQHQFKSQRFRVLEFQKEIDTTLPTIVFVHGSPGSILDFKKYCSDADLRGKANLITYERVGYGIDETGNVQESIAFETALLEDLLIDLDKRKTILVGYSYGGPIALASKYKYKKIVLLAPAVYSKVEPMPWILNFYRWKTTRWLLPDIWKAASKEKLSHKKDLLNFENNWKDNPSKILSVHGNNDWIVPYENSLYLKEKFPSKQFELVTLEDAGHGLVWSHFTAIKNILLQQLKEK
ncbi:MAG: hypothetical protein CVU08_13925 [Bacteroidetes bacterium HGW-Bacteroidetes-3]|jgi:pimeloyl-ACP methyl ester carboxylesterase|nr:MAG: hypothetical protein CVU08_13925 [Bacteroidetes bacterium HGW-Bacteroidetes-3]